MTLTGKIKRFAIILFAIAGLFLFGSMNAQAVPVQAVTAKKLVNTWVQNNDHMYYYNAQGKKLTGIQKIGKRTYLFDKKGRQKLGWQKVKNSYYYFRIVPGKGGYMVQSKTVNQIYLRKNGKAGSAGRRMALLWKCTQIVERLTKPTWTCERKMQTVWTWFQSNLGYHGLTFYLSGDWDVYYAALTLANGWGSCEGLGYAWAFLANACGAKVCYSVSDTGHGWAEIDGRVYDPACARYDRQRDSYYAMPMSLSGVGGRPNYARNGIYRKRV